MKISLVATMKRLSVVNLAPRWLSRQEQAKLLHEIEKEKRDWKKKKDLAIAQTMLERDYAFLKS